MIWKGDLLAADEKTRFLSLQHWRQDCEVRDVLRFFNVNRAIAGKRNTTVVKLRSARMLLAPGFLRRVFEIFETHRVSVDVVATVIVAVHVHWNDTVGVIGFP